MEQESTIVIEQALKDIRGRSSRYQLYERYYRGLHRLEFASEKFRNAFGGLFSAFADNLCGIVADAVPDALEVTGFSVEEGEAKLADAVWKIWQRNHLGLRANEVHKEAAKCGDAYVIVWPNANGEATIYPNRAALCTVRYDAEMPGRTLWGAKLWLTEPDASKRRFVRLNLYFPDRIEKYITVNSQPNGLPQKARAFKPFEVTGEAWPLPNDWGVVPVFHFGNNASVGAMGCSELEPVAPLQDALNKAVLDMLVAMEFAAFKQRWVVGVEMGEDKDGNPIPPFVPGVERLWASDNPDTKFGEFSATDLEQFTKVQNDFRAEIARVSGIPLHYLYLGKGDFPSGEALKKSESRFLKKVTRRQENYGAVWEDAMALALRMEGGGDAARLFAAWADPAPETRKELLEGLVMEKAIGATEGELLAKAGYGEEDIKQMQAEKAAAREAAMKAFDGGLP